MSRLLCALILGPVALALCALLSSLLFFLGGDREMAGYLFFLHARLYIPLVSGLVWAIGGYWLACWIASKPMKNPDIMGPSIMVQVPLASFFFGLLFGLGLALFSVFFR